MRVINAKLHFLTLLVPAEDCVRLPLVWRWMSNNACTCMREQPITKPRNPTPETVCVCVSCDPTAPPRHIVLSGMVLLCVYPKHAHLKTAPMGAERRGGGIVCVCVFHLSTKRVIYVLEVEGVNKNKSAHTHCTHTPGTHHTALFAFICINDTHMKLRARRGR